MQMRQLDDIQKRLIAEVADLHKVPEGAYNFRVNSGLAGRNTTANIDIISKEDGTGIDIHIAPGTKNESVHIPVVLSQSGLKETVYNDFYVGAGSDVVIVAGCGIDNCGMQDSEHDGIHRFFVEKGAHVRYVEKHYGSGDGTGKRILNPVTEVYMDEDSSMEMVQIKGVDSTERATSPIRNSTPVSSETRPRKGTPSAIRSSWTRARSWRSRRWMRGTSTPSWCMKRRSERSPGSSS